GLIPNPSVNYASPNATGTLTYTPIANQFGSATITVTVNDAATGKSVAHTFVVNVQQVTNAPTLGSIPNPAAIVQNSGAQTICLTAITSGLGNSHAVTVPATSNNLTLIPNPSVTYSSPNTTGTLTFTPNANQFGSATITVTVTDTVTHLTAVQT